MTKRVISTEASIGRQLLIVKKKKYIYTPEDVSKVFEILDEAEDDETKIHAQEIADQSIFSARQIKKLRYIKRHMTEIEYRVLISCKYYISSLEKYIKRRIKIERDKKVK
jgi:hypothetical protein